VQHITTIILDLDDTLWDLPAVILHAERTIYRWFGENYPDISRQFTIEDIRQLRNDVAEDHPDMGHDLMYLRDQTYRRLAAATGYPEAMSKDAFDVFQEARNQVVLYEDVLPALQLLGARYQMATLSNGNADLDAVGINGHFVASWSARDLGRAKPDPDVFIQVCEHLNVQPEQVLHIGDDPYNDVEAPRNAGMSAVWVNRRGRDWPEDLVPPADEISSLMQLQGILGV